MAKYTAKFSAKGILDLDDMTVTEIKKDEELVFDFLQQLQQFDGKHVTISITEDIELEPVEEN